MSNVREDIARNIVQQLEGIVVPQVASVSRNPINTQNLSITQYPAIMVRTTTEDRADQTQGTAGLRFGELEYTIQGFVRVESAATTVNDNIDTQRNTLIEAISEKLEEDRTRGGNAMNSFVENISVDDGTIFPLGRVDIVYRVLYKYTKGTL